MYTLVLNLLLMQLQQVRKTDTHSVTFEKALTSVMAPTMIKRVGKIAIKKVTDLFSKEGK